jgi:hypothetical protein
VGICPLKREISIGEDWHSITHVPFKIQPTNSSLR